MSNDLFKPIAKTFYTTAGFWFMSTAMLFFTLLGLSFAIGSLWCLLFEPVENIFGVASLIALLLVGALSCAYFGRLLVVQVWPQRSFFITIDRTGITSNGFKPLDTSDSMTYCESKTFPWTEIEEVGYTTFPKAGPSFMVLILKNDEIQTVILQQFFSWESIQKEIDAFMPCANFGDHRAFLTSHLQQN